MSAAKTSNAIPIKFQIISVLITVFIIGLMTFASMRRFCSKDQMPEITELDYDKLSVSKKKPEIVQVNLSINNFFEFDIKQNKFKFSGVIWFTFNPENVSEEIIDKFSFEKGDTLEKSKSKSFVSGGKKTIGYNIRVSFKTNLYNGYFPFQDHKIYLVLENNESLINDIIFKSSPNDLIVDWSYLSGWEYFNQNVYEGYGTTKLTGGEKLKEVHNPRIIFELNYFNYSPRLVVLILLPLILVMLLELLSLCLDQRKLQGSNVFLSLGNIAALFAYRFVIENISPNVAYQTIADHLFFLFLSVSFLTFLIHGIGPYWTKFQKKIISVGLQAYVLSVLFYIYNFWMVCS